MKKVQVTIALVFALVVGVFANASAQTYKLENVLVTSYRVAEGSNSVPLPNGHGTLRFMMRGGKIANVMHQDAAGKITRLADTDPGTGHNPNPNPECKWEERCVYNQENGTAVCFCTPDVIKSNEPVGIALLLPAVQKVREAASRL